MRVRIVFAFMAMPVRLLQRNVAVRIRREREGRGKDIHRNHRDDHKNNSQQTNLKASTHRDSFLHEN